jgi:hypothetical protein
MSVPEPTVDELIATFNRSSMPIVAVEGKTDREILRHLENLTGIGGLIFPCGGCNNIFDILDRSHDITNKQVVFMADQDMCCIHGSRRLHPRLIYTWGFSIENDVIAGSKIDRLLRPEERPTFAKLRWLVARYFAYEYEKALAEAREPVWDVSLQMIIDMNNLTYKSNIAHQDEIYTHDTRFCRRLHKEIKRLLRGKQLLQLYLLILNKPRRSVKFSNMALLECCSCLGENHRLNALAREIRQKLQALSI